MVGQDDTASTFCDDTHSARLIAKLHTVPDHKQDFGDWTGRLGD
jgi:hypothetical protein